MSVQLRRCAVVIATLMVMSVGLVPGGQGGATGADPIAAVRRLVAALFAPRGARAAGPEPAPPAVGPVVRSEAEAARETIRPVEIVSARTATTTTWVNPDGTHRTDFAAGVVRVKDAQGWHDVDTTLAVTSEGARPRHAPVSMAFSRGGDSALARLTTAGRSIALDWPEPLPAPSLDGAVATYADVHPDVDLTLEATATGFEQSFVLHRRPAEAPALRVPLRLGGLRLRQLASGDLQLVNPAGTVVLQAPEPRMWDSSWDDRTGEARHSAPLDVTIEQTPGGADVVVRPDPAFLADPDVVYPVYLDPATSLPNAGDTWVESGYTSNQNGSTELRAGTYDSGSSIARSLLKFDVASLSGKNVIDATLKLFEFHSWSCSARAVNVYRPLSAWNPSTVTWSSGMPSTTTTVYSSANVANGYSTSCPDAWVNLGGLGELVGWWVSGAYANNGFMVKAASETDNYGWKKFYSSAHGTYVPALSVTYNTPPATPSSATPVANTKSTDLTPTLSTKYSDSDSGDTGYVRYEVRRTSDNALITSGNGPSVSPGSYSTWTVPASKLADGTAYYWKAQAFDGVDSSAWTGNIAYTPDTSGPTGAVTSPATGSTLSGTVTLTATPTDGTTGSGVKQASFYVTARGRKVLLGTDTSSTGGWTATFDTTTVPDGRAQVSAEYLDVLNNASCCAENAQAAVTIANAAPGHERWTAAEVVPMFHDPAVEAHVGLADGQLRLSAAEASAPGRYPVSAERTYLSGTRTRGMFGIGWRGEPEDGLATGTDGTVTRTDAAGRRHAFTPVYSPGLTAQFYGNTGLTGTPVATRVDPQVSFDWSTAAPATGVPADNWSARWSGYVDVPATGTWTFYGTTDDGVRILVDDVYVNVDWRAHAATETSGTIALSAGRHKIEMQYFDSGSYASAVLSWAGPGIAKQVIPAASLSRVTGYNRPPGVDETLTTLADGSLSVTDHDGERAVFDAAGRRTYVGDQNGNAVATAYDSSGRPQYLCAVDAALPTCGSANAGVTYAYDTNGRVISETGSGGRVWTFGYDTSGRLATVTDPTGRAVTYAYDTQGRLASVALGGGTASVLYDAGGRVATIHDARSATYGTTFTTSGSTVTVRSPVANAASPLGAAASYTVGPKGQLVASTDPVGRTTTHEWNADLYRTSTTDPLGRTRTATYDERGNVLSDTNTRGGTTTYTYDASNNLLTTTNPLGQVVTNTYNATGNLLSTTDPLGRRTTYTYDSRGQVLTTTRPAGNAAGAAPGSYVTTFAYDAAGNRTSETDALGNTTTYTFDVNGLELTQTDPLAHTESRSYDAAGRLLSQVDGEGGTTTLAYDSAGRVVTEVPADGNEPGAVPAEFAKTTTYDPDGRPRTERVGTQPATVYAYDLDGELVSETDPRGYETTHVTDLAGQRLRTTDASGVQTDHTYDAAGNPATIATPTGVTTTVYDGDELLVSSSGPRLDDNGQPLLSTYTYDAAGRTLTVTAAKGNVAGAAPGSFTTTYTYDAAGQLVSVSDPAGGTTTYTYDQNGNRTSITDPAGAVTATAYDQLDRETSRQVPSSVTETLTGTADAAAAAWTSPVTTTRSGVVTGALRWTGFVDLSLELLDAGGTPVASSATWENPETLVTAALPAGTYTWRVSAANGYTAFSLDTSVPSVTTATKVYDAAGRVASETDPAGTTTFAYDDADRATSLTSPDGTRTYTYDAGGEVVAATYAGGGFTATYDSASRVQSYTSGGVTSTYTYDAANNPTSVTTPTLTRSYTWDASSRLAAVSGTSTFAYADQVNRTTVVAASGDTESRTFAADGLTTKVALSTSQTATPWLQWAYTYDANGNVTQVNDVTSGTPATLATYGYDGSDRLTSEQLAIGAGTRSSSWTYDTSGNRLSATVDGAVTTYSYDAAGQLARVVAPGGAQTGYFYDTRGNLTAVDAQAGRTTYAWDAAGLLTAVSPASGQPVSFGYDVAGDRVSRTTGAVVRTARNDADGRLTEESEGSTRIASYTYDDSGTPLTIDVPGVGVLTYRYDRTGSAIALTDADHTVVASYRYDAWGNHVSRTGSAAVLAANRFTFRAAYGIQWDEPTGLFMMGVRWYDPVLGRFLSRDAIEDATVTGSYVYALANPVAMLDASGLYPVCDDEGRRACGSKPKPPPKREKRPPRACRCGKRTPLPPPEDIPTPPRQSDIMANRTSLGSCVRSGDKVSCSNLRISLLELPRSFKARSISSTVKVNGGALARFRQVVRALDAGGQGREIYRFETWYMRPRKSAKTGKFLPGAPSLHSWGVAVDVGRWDLNSSHPVVKIFGKYKWEWGGQWKSNKDPIHFQWARTS